MVTAHAEGRFNHGRVRALTRLHPRDVTLKLQELVRTQMLCSAGSGKGTTYSLSREAKAIEPQPTSDESLVSSDETSDESIGSSDETSDESFSSSTKTSDKRSWAPIQEQRLMLLDFCRGKWRSLSEIASALRRKENTVRTTYLPPLLDSGILVRRYESPQHPHQAYKSAANYEELLPNITPEIQSPDRF